MKQAARKTTPPSAAATADQTQSIQERWLPRIRAVLIAATVALIVATPLITSEGAVSQSTHVVLIMGWLSLTVAWLAQSLLQSQPIWHIGPAGGVLLLFLLLHSISAVVRLHSGHARLTLNALWLWVSFGCLFLAVRQLVRSGVEQRAVCGVLLALAAGLAVLGFYQVAYSNPKLRAEYAENPDAMLRREGEYAPPGSPQRAHIENRIASVEPIGPFALTNSLAGFLAPCLVLLIGLAVPLQRAFTQRWRAVAGLVLLILITAGCLLLTKSRAAYLAVTVGACLLALVKVTALSRRDWRRLTAAAAGLVVIAGCFVALGGLDREVLTEAPKSLRYRIEYWRATVSMMADYPWLGCGPGNFKEFYTQYKLPEASEEVADPHNFLLEVGATAGLPALLVFALIGVAVLWQLRRCLTMKVDRVVRGLPERGPPLADAEQRAFIPIYAGVGIGVLLAFPAGWVGGLGPRLELLWVTLPVAAATLWFIHPWVTAGALSCGPLVIAAATLLVNLLAAGGIGFPGVAEVLWVLLALALNVGEAGEQELRPTTFGPFVAKGVITAALVGALLLVLLCHLTMYRPVLAASGLYAQALETKSFEESSAKYSAAAAADPWWADPYETVAALLCRQWIADPSDARLSEFEQVLDALLQRDRHSSLLFRRCGNWWIDMAVSSGRQDLLPRAIEAHTQSVRLYPNSGILHAQLAWDFFLAGDIANAGREADKALWLDERLPHEELKLRHQPLAGGGALVIQGGGEATGPGPHAEQRMQDIRRARQR